MKKKMNLVAVFDHQATAGDVLLFQRALPVWRLQFWARMEESDERSEGVSQIPSLKNKWAKERGLATENLWKHIQTFVEHAFTQNHFLKYRDSFPWVWNLIIFSHFDITMIIIVDSYLTPLKTNMEPQKSPNST